MLPFLVGTAVIASPPCISVPVIGIVAAVKGIRGLRRQQKRMEKQASLQAPEKVDTQDSVQPVVLEWSDLSLSLTDAQKNIKHILKGVSGIAKPGRLVAIMGPSGSGKTTLLNTLAGQVELSKKSTLTGTLTVNGKFVTSSNHKQAYVRQEDILFSQLTVRETLELAAQLRLPQNLTKEKQTAYVDSLVNLLSLNQCIDTVVGDAKTRGISGGEKKRLSIGCELVASPSLVFLDEPTTGLDAFQAEKVMSTLSHLARSGHTVVCSIHQPRSSIFNMFDDLVLLAEGRCLYCGPAQSVLDHFESLGHKCPDHYNPADFLADMISTDNSSPEAQEASRARVTRLADAWQKQTAGKLVRTESHAMLPEPEKNVTHKAGPLKQLQLLFVRSWRQATRDKSAVVSRIMANFSSAVIFGSIYWRMKRKQSNIQDRMGLLQVVAVNAAMSSLVKTLNVFPREATIVRRERSASSYDIWPYLTSKLVAELPLGAVFPLLFGTMVYPLTGLNPNPVRFVRFLGTLTLESFASSALGLAVGAIAPSTEAAIAMGPAVMLVWIVFGGFYVNADNVPGPLKLLPRASLIKQSFEALCINEFKGLEFEADENGRGMRDGDAVLHWLSLNNTIPRAAIAQSRILLFYYWATYCILKAKKPQYLEVQPLSDSSETEAGATAMAPVTTATRPAATAAATPASTAAAASPVQADAKPAATAAATPVTTASTPAATAASTPVPTTAATPAATAATTPTTATANTTPAAPSTSTTTPAATATTTPSGLSTSNDTTAATASTTHGATATPTTLAPAGAEPESTSESATAAQSAKLGTA